MLLHVSLVALHPLGKLWTFPETLKARRSNYLRTAIYLVLTVNGSQVNCCF